MTKTERVIAATPELIEELKWDFPDRPEFWQSTPPLWALDPFNDNDHAKCGDCGSWLEVVRPGKSQCPACGSDHDRALRWRAASALEAILARVAANSNPETKE